MKKITYSLIISLSLFYNIPNYSETNYFSTTNIGGLNVIDLDSRPFYDEEENKSKSIKFDLQLIMETFFNNIEYINISPNVDIKSHNEFELKKRREAYKIIHSNYKDYTYKISGYGFNYSKYNFKEKAYEVNFIQLNSGFIKPYLMSNVTYGESSIDQSKYAPFAKLNSKLLIRISEEFGEKAKTESYWELLFKINRFEDTYTTEKVWGKVYKKTYRKLIITPISWVVVEGDGNNNYKNFEKIYSIHNYTIKKNEP